MTEQELANVIWDIREVFCGSSDAAKIFIISEKQAGNSRIVMMKP